MFFTICVIVLFLSIFLGARIGGLGIAYGAGIGLFIYTMVFGLTPGNIPVDVVFIIIAVIGMICILELSGGLTYLVYLAEKVLKSNPKFINYLAPLVTFFMTVFAGTGHTSYSLMPVIIEVAKSQGIRPSRPLTLAIVMAQIGIVASPISAAVVAFLIILQPFAITLPHLLIIMIPSAVVASLISSFIISFLPQKLETDKNYQKLLSEGKIPEKTAEQRVIPPRAPIAVLIFLLTVLAIVIYSIFPELKPIYPSTGKPIGTALLIIILMLLGSYIMVSITKVEISKLTSQSTFKAGMSAALCVIGVAWLGDTLISNYSVEIKEVAGDFLQSNGWAFAVVVFFLASLLYSPAVTTLALMPLGVVLGLPVAILIGSFAAVCNLFLLPTYPTAIAAVQMDYTGTTRIGKYVLNHSFLLPATIIVFFTCLVAYFMSYIVL
jgi:anaerobic C4-dicarboxylate transporter DcuA